MVYKVKHDELSEIIKQHYSKKITLFVWGTFGIGKSRVFKEVAKEIALQLGKEFVVWHEISESKKKEIFENSDKYFVLIDIRLSEYDSSDIKGLPEFRNDSEGIEFKIPRWALLTQKENSYGMLLFDEINLATPIVQSSCYKILYDRVVNESKIGDNWGIFGGGNLTSDRAYTHEISPPLRDRGSEVQLITPNIDTWTNWALKNNIDSRIIGFLNFKTGSLYVVNFDDEQKFTTTRGYERLSTLIKGINNFKMIEHLSCSAIGEGIAREFVAFCKISEQIDLEGIIKNPNKLKDITEISIKYFLISALAEQFKDNKISFDKIYEISKILDEMKNAEFVALLWKLCYGYSPKFKKGFIEKADTDFVSKYAKYLVD